MGNDFQKITSKKIFFSILEINIKDFPSFFNEHYSIGINLLSPPHVTYCRISSPSMYWFSSLIPHNIFISNKRAEYTTREKILYGTVIIYC